jgi:hypothetical protein
LDIQPASAYKERHIFLSERSVTNVSHERVWAVIDALAARYSLSASGLAKRAGLI